MQPPSISIAATFTADPLREPLTFWMKETGVALEVAFAPYSQVFQQLLDPASLLSRNKEGVNVILVRVEDWQREAGGIAAWSAEAVARVEQGADDLLRALEGASARGGAPHIVAICPPSDEALADAARASFLRHIEERIVAVLASRSAVYPITTAELAALYPVAAVADRHGDELGHIPYTAAYFAALGTLLARKVYALKSLPRKVIAVDCDETLWKGVVGEAGPLGIEIDPPRRAVQEHLVRQKESGMVLCVTSKNAEQDVLDVFAERADMPLRREHFVATRINWQRKSDNLRSLAAELGLGLDSFIFLDDNPVECAEVGATCPAVLAVQLPEEVATIPAFLQHHWAFDHLRVTEEDRRRTALYAQNAERERLRKGSLTLSDFLAGLGLEVTIAAPAPAQIARVAQLTQRTNQFNCTTRRKTEGEIAEIGRDASKVCRTTTVKDRFGDYGLVGVMIAEPRGEALVVDSFLLSCRVLGRGVENRMLRELGEIASARGLARVDVPFLPTKKNQPARDFLEGAGARYREGEGEELWYRFPAAAAAALPLTPFVAEVAEDAGAAPKATSSTGPAPTALLDRIARELRDVEAILAAIAADRRKEQGAAEAPMATGSEAAALTPVEATIAEIWSEVLASDVIGTGQDFVELGGDSLRAAQVAARLNRSFGIHLSQDSVLESRTIQGLAAIITEKLAEQDDDLLREIEDA